VQGITLSCAIFTEIKRPFDDDFYGLKMSHLVSVRQNAALQQFDFCRQAGRITCAWV